MIEIVPAILRKTYEKIEADWERVREGSSHIHVDVTDGIFAGEGTFRALRRFKRLTDSQKLELHLMVHTPAHFVDEVLDVQPARCIFHLESFAGSRDAHSILKHVRAASPTQLALAINPDTPTNYIEEFLSLCDYVLFMGYHPGWSNQPINPLVFNKIKEFVRQHPDTRIAVDGHVTKETIPKYVAAGASILCSNSAIFAEGDPLENIRQLTLLAQSAL